MNDLDVRGIITHMKRLHKIEPDPGCCAGAVSRARRALIRRSVARWSLRALAAAAVIVVVAFAATALLARPASAAQALVQAADNSAAYKG